MVATEPDGPAGTIPHGRNGYVHHGCRCAICRRGHADFTREYRRRRAERTGEKLLHGRFTGPSSSS